LSFHLSTRSFSSFHTMFIVCPGRRSLRRAISLTWLVSLHNLVSIPGFHNCEPLVSFSLFLFSILSVGLIKFKTQRHSLTPFPRVCLVVPLATLLYLKPGYSLVDYRGSLAGFRHHALSSSHDRLLTLNTKLAAKTEL